MVLSEEMLQYLIPLGVAVILSLVISVIAQRGVPSMKVFFMVIAITLSVFVVEHVLPVYTFMLVAIAIGIVWFGGRN